MRLRHLCLFIGLAVALAVALTGCGADKKDRVTRWNIGGRDRINAVLDPTLSVLIATPPDVAGPRRLGAGSGALAAQAIDAAFSRYAHIVDVTPAAYTSFDALLPTLAAGDYGYVVLPQLLDWNLRDATSGANGVSRIRVKITILDAANGNEIASAVLESKPKPASEFAAAFTDGTAERQPPESLLLPAAETYADHLYHGRDGVALPQDDQAVSQQ